MDNYKSIKGYPKILIRKEIEPDLRLIPLDFKKISILKNNYYFIEFLKMNKYIVNNYAVLYIYLQSVYLPRKVVESILDIVKYFNSYFIIKYFDYHYLLNINPTFYLEESLIIEYNLEIYNKVVCIYNRAVFITINEIESLKNKDIFIVFCGVKYYNPLLF